MEPVLERLARDPEAALKRIEPPDVVNDRFTKNEPRPGIANDRPRAEDRVMGGDGLVRLHRTRIEEVACLTRPIGIGSLAKQVTHTPRGGTMDVQKSPSGKLVVTKDGPVTRITLNRPECHNALDREVSAELNQTIKDVNVDRGCRIVVLTGAGNTFCAGDDIKEFNEWKPADAN